MQNLKIQLKGITDTLTSLSKQLEELIHNLQSETKEQESEPISEKKEVSVKKRKSMSLLDTVYLFIKRSRNGATIAQLRKKTGLEDRQLSNALYKLAKQGKIQGKARGVYDTI